MIRNLQEPERDIQVDEEDYVLKDVKSSIESEESAIEEKTSKVTIMPKDDFRKVINIEDRESKGLEEDNCQYFFG